jgi:hypothetical protein
MNRKLTRLAWTVRYLAPAQVYHRARLRIRGAWWKLRSARAEWGNGDVQIRELGYLGGLKQPLLVSERNSREVAEAHSVLTGLQQNEFRFLSRTRKFDRGIEWNSPMDSHLWRYHLHYFNYVDALILAHLCPAQAEDDGKAYREFRRLTEAWLTDNTHLKGDGWHPYTVSLRLVNWLNGAEAFQADLAADPDHRRRLTAGILGQASILARSLELDVRGNHLLENLRALIWVASAIDTSETRKWGRAALALLEVELNEQVLPDGGHFERCPGYHTLVLQRLIEIARRTRLTPEGTPAWLIQHVRSMLAFLLRIRTPAGSIPLLKDSAYDACPSVDEVLTEGALLLGESRYATLGILPIRSRLLFGTSAPPPPAGLETPAETDLASHLPHSGYVCCRTPDRSFFILDVGRPCPDYLPAHAHADIFTFELWIRGLPWVVDAGVFEYTAGPWRDYFRSTRAHNTVEVDDANQSDVYSSFRVGRRARVRDVTFGPIEGGGYCAQAVHDGYGHRGASHRRVVVFEPGVFWVFIDLVSGTGSHVLRSHIHFQPGVTLVQRAADRWTASQPGGQIHISTLGQQETRIVSGLDAARPQGWHSTHFGHKCANPALELTMNPTLPSVAAYGISDAEPAQLVALPADESGSRSIHIACGRRAFQVRIPGDAATRATITTILPLNPLPPR